MWSPTSRVPLSTQSQIQIQPDTVPIVETSPAIISTAEHAELKPSCSSQDRKSDATIRNVISTLQKGGANDTVDLNLIIHTLRETDIQEYILRSYGTCLRFLQLSTHAPHFQVQLTPSGDVLITCTQKPQAVHVNPIDLSC